MRRALALPLALAMLVGVAACSARPGEEPPASSPASEAPEPSASPTPTPQPTPEGERFDDVDLAATLVPLETYGDEGWGTGTHDALVGGDSWAFSASPGCAMAVDGIGADVAEEIVYGGDLYEGVPWARVSVARMASPEDAQGYLDALEAAATACAGVVGSTDEPSGLVVLESGADASTLLADAGMTQLSLGYADSFHLYLTAFTALDELVLWSSSDAMVEGWDTSLHEDIQTEVAAFDAAAPAS